MTGSGGAITETGREETSADEWKRISQTFTLPEDAASDLVTVRLNAVGDAGDVWYDAAQLEEGVTAGRLNLIQNSDFRNNLTDWSTVSGVSNGNRAELYQDITLSGNKGDVFVAGGWSKANSTPRKGSMGRYSLKISFYNGSSWQTGTDGYVLWS